MFAHMGRRQPNRDAAQRPSKTGVTNRTPGSMPRLTDGCIGQTDQAHRGKALGDINLDGHHGSGHAGDHRSTHLG
jgi:hypothetical protein